MPSLVDLVGGCDRVARGESFIYVANHTSWFDIPVLLLTVPGQVRMLAKRSLFKVPVLGWSLWGGGFIPVDREDRKRASGAFAQAVERLESGCSVLVFAEGTRSYDGKLAPFKRGGFVLALKSGRPIVPVGVRGTFEVMPRTTLWVRPGKASVHYGEPVDVAAFGLRGRKELMQTVRDRMAELVGQDPSPG